MGNPIGNYSTDEYDEILARLTTFTTSFTASLTDPNGAELWLNQYRELSRDLDYMERDIDQIFKDISLEVEKGELSEADARAMKSEFKNRYLNHRQELVKLQTEAVDFYREAMCQEYTLCKEINAFTSQPKNGDNAAKYEELYAKAEMCMRMLKDAKTVFGLADEHSMENEAQERIDELTLYMMDLEGAK